MADVIVVRPGTTLWRELDAVRPDPGTWADFTLTDATARVLGIPAGRVTMGAVNTYLGETEQRLADVLDRTSEGGAVVLFDEADALFGKRTEVRDAHDRYANVEGAYLLSRDQFARVLPAADSRRRWWRPRRPTDR